MINDIYKTRSCPACITAALNIYSNNFTKIFRATWLWILAFSMVCGLSAFMGDIITDSVPAILFQGFTIIAILTVAFVLDICIASNVVAMLNEEKIKSTRIKIIKVKLLEIFVLFLTGLFSAGSIYGVTRIGFIQRLPMTTSAIVITATAIIVLVAAAIVFSPLIYSATKYVLEPGIKLRCVVGKLYCVGGRRLGFLFSILIVIILIGFILYLFLCIPACITFTASNIDKLGMISGDKTGLPPYFAWLNFISSSIMAFITQYMAIWTMLAAFYAYGSVESYKNTTEER